MKKRDNSAVSSATKRDDILSGALRLFSQQGFQATTARQLASESSVSLRTLFKYFPNKEAILEQLLSDFFLEINRVAGAAESFPEMVSNPKPSVDEWYEQIIQNRLAAFARHKDILKVLFTELPTNEKLRDLVVKNFREQLWNRSRASMQGLREKRVVHEEIDLDDLLRVTISIHIGMFFTEHVLGLKLDHSKAIEQNKRILFEGVLNKKRENWPT